MSWKPLVGLTLIVAVVLSVGRRFDSIEPMSGTILPTVVVNLGELKPGLSETIKGPPISPDTDKVTFELFPKDGECYWYHTWLELRPRCIMIVSAVLLDEPFDAVHSGLVAHGGKRSSVIVDLTSCGNLHAGNILNVSIRREVGNGVSFARWGHVTIYEFPVRDVKL